MDTEMEVMQNGLNDILNEPLNNAAAIITKDYLDELETYKIIDPSEEDIDVDIVEYGKFYKLTKLVVNREESFLNKLTTIVNVASSIDCSITTVIRSDGFKIDYYLGIISKDTRLVNELDIARRDANETAFKGALLGNLPGSELRELSKDEVNDFRESVLARKGNCYSAVSGLVSLRDKGDKSVDGYVQGIENLVDSLKGQKYTIVMLADPIETSGIRVIKQGYEILHTQLSTFARSSVTINKSDTLSLTESRTEGISEGISKGITLTQSKTKSKGKYFGGNISVGIDLGITANVGFSAGINSGTAEQTGRSEQEIKIRQTNRAKVKGVSSSKTKGKSLQLNYENRSVKALLDKIDKHLERLDECESFGAFDCAAYIIADKRETAFSVASNYNALMRGKDSSVQCSHINSWFKEEDTGILGKYIGALVHPRFWRYKADKKDKDIIVTPASIVSGDELAIQIGLPKKSVSGVTVIPMAPFGRNVMESTEDTMELGNLYHMGYDEGGNGRKEKVRIDVESLSMHTFITGSTGAGKSTAIYSILDKLIEHKVKSSIEKIRFMVIEPAKGEYKNRFGNYPNVKVYGTNDKKMPLLRINPFSFPQDIHVLEHIDRLIEIFNVCWPMYAAMPAVLKDSIERAYIVSGWNLETSESRYIDSNGMPLFPSFVDVLEQINIVMDESSYSSDSKGDYKGALCTRLRSLTNGLYRQIFTNNELSAEELFDRNVIVDLSRTGSGETKSLIMGLLVMKLQEYRMSNATSGNSPLKHVTVLEEAHNILKRTSQEQSGEGANLLGKSVEMLANSIAEMRTYGEGFIIADQAPGLLDMSVIRNTNTKIILRLPDLNDRELVGRAASLNDDQILELSRLKTFVAAVYQNNWLEPVLCNIDTNLKNEVIFKYNQKKEIDPDKEKILEYLLLSIKKRDMLDGKYITELIDSVYRLPIPAEVKISFIRYTKAKEKDEIQKLREQVVYYIFNSETAFGLAKQEEGKIDVWYKHIREILEPDITFLSEIDQQKVIAILTKEKAGIDRNKESMSLFDRFMDFI